MNFSKLKTGTILSIGAAIILSVLGSWFFINEKLGEINVVSAAPSDNISGWAWSAYVDGSGNNVGVGWISFNCIDTGSCGSSNYGVNVSPITGTGIFSGYAWSSNIGWISFNSGDLTGCPSGTCSARIDWPTGKVTGWARALSAPAAGSNSGNWDGWINLGAVGTSPGISLNLATGNFSGYAWGGDTVIGWIDFNPNGGGVKFTPPALPVAGACGLSAGVAKSPPPPSTNLCAVGTPSSVANNNSTPSYFWSWTCAGVNGGSSASCFAPYPQCRDGFDNDNNGLTDYPNDPGCSSANDNSENNTFPQCSDWLDNDGDGKIDIADPECHTDGDASNGGSYNPNGPNEGGECSDGKDNNANGVRDIGDPACHTDGDKNNSATYDPSRKERSYNYREI